MAHDLCDSRPIDPLSALVGYISIVKSICSFPTGWHNCELMSLHMTQTKLGLSAWALQIVTIRRTHDLLKMRHHCHTHSPLQVQSTCKGKAMAALFLAAFPACYSKPASMLNSTICSTDRMSTWKISIITSVINLESLTPMMHLRPATDCFRVSPFWDEINNYYTRSNDLRRSKMPLKSSNDSLSLMMSHHNTSNRKVIAYHDI